jgi:hypothetical protein
MTTGHTPLDSLKYLAATADSQIDWVVDQLGQLGDGEDEAFELLQTMLSGLKDSLREELAQHCPPAQREVYGDGRRVVSRLPIEDSAVVWHKHWHPNPRDVENKPRTLGETTTFNGDRRRVIVAADQVLDVVDARGHLSVVRSAPPPGEPSCADVDAALDDEPW